MTIEDIRKLVSGDETREVELKKTTGELKDAMHSACAFLNTDGGWLLFGVTPVSLKIVGQNVTENTRRELAQALAGIEPVVDVRVEYVNVPDSQGLQVIALCFDGWVWGKEPFTYHGRPYYRVESVTKVMPRDMYDERLRANKPHKFAWERQPAEGLKLEDLSQERIRGAVRLGVEMGRMSEMAFTEPVAKVLEKWRLFTDGANIMEPHGSYPYNPLIADVLYKTSYLQSWGSGVKRIVEACRKQNVPNPEWSMSGGFVTVTFHRNIQTSTQISGRKDDRKDDRKELTERQKVIIDLIKENDQITIFEMTEKTESSDKSVRRDLIILQQKGYITREGGRKQGRWVVLVK